MKSIYKRLILWIVLASIVTLVFFLIGVASSGSFSMKLWSEDSRSGISLFYGISMVGIILISLFVDLRSIDVE